ncbi:hypothetical protein LSH36_342g04007 [Paralvinella palmiformis]|uniref:Uncharacterized protein n=1 Tax=Paralvinella palmiformis TaxID=53620 RepID=A0AAD9JF56_9ANNE|nr:hypothetical protein LSH36_342g04007 [Paralvinella palmiformis]
MQETLYEIATNRNRNGIMEQNVVLAVDKTLYQKLVKLKWSVEEYKDILIPCLGGLHIAKNVLGVIGWHMTHYDSMACTRLYMKAGTSKAAKYFPVHEIGMLLSPDQVDTPLAFHSIIGCDSVSQFSGHGEKTTWTVFQHLSLALFARTLSPKT